MIGHVLRKIDNIVVKQRILGIGSNPPWRIGILRNDDGNDNAVNKWFDWLKEEKQSCCFLVWNFAAKFWRSLRAKRRRKISYLRFWRQRVPTAVHRSFSAFTWQPFEKWIRMIFGQTSCFFQFSCIFSYFSTGFFSMYVCLFSRDMSFLEQVEVSWPSWGHCICSFIHSSNYFQLYSVQEGFETILVLL